MSAITKAVLPITDFGTRTPLAAKDDARAVKIIADKPLIRYAVEEAAAAGVRELIFVIGGTVRGVDPAHEPNAESASCGNREMLEEVNARWSPGMARISMCHQRMPGLGRAILAAKPAIGDEPFAVIVPDDLIEGQGEVLARMADLYDCYRCSILGVKDEEGAEPKRSDVVVCDVVLGTVSRIAGIFHKSRTPFSSTSGVVGWYVLTPRIFHHLEAITPRAGDELGLADAIRNLLHEERVLAYRVGGTCDQCGALLGFLRAARQPRVRGPEMLTGISRGDEDFRAQRAKRYAVSEPTGTLKLAERLKVRLSAFLSSF